MVSRAGVCGWVVLLGAVAACCTSAACSSESTTAPSHAAAASSTPTKPIVANADDLEGDCTVTTDVYTDPDGNTCTTTTASTDACCGISSDDECAGIDLSDWSGPDETVDGYDDTCNGQIAGDDSSGNQDATASQDSSGGEPDAGAAPSGDPDQDAGADASPGDDASFVSTTVEGNCHVTVYTYTTPPPGRYSSCSWTVATPSPCCGITTEPRCPIDVYPAYYDDEVTNYDGNCTASQ